MFWLTSSLKKAVGRSLESQPGTTDTRKVIKAKARKIRQMFACGRRKYCERSNSGTKLSFSDFQTSRLAGERYSYLNRLFKQGLSDCYSKVCFGLQPILASTYTLSQLLFKTAMSIGVLPFSSTSWTLAPASQNFCRTSGRLLYAAQWISAFLEGSTYPDQLAILAPWMAQQSTFPSSTAPFSFNNSTYYLLQYMPATSKGVCPRLVALLRIGSPCLRVLRQRGRQGEL